MEGNEIEDPTPTEVTPGAATTELPTPAEQTAELPAPEKKWGFSGLKKAEIIIGLVMLAIIVGLTVVILSTDKSPSPGSRERAGNEAGATKEERQLDRAIDKLEELIK